MERELMAIQTNSPAIEAIRIEEARNRLICIMTNAPEKFIDGVRQLSKIDIIRTYERRGIIPAGSFRHFELDETGKEIKELCDSIRGEKFYDFF